MGIDPDIALLATYSIDRIIDRNGILISEQNGGPALYISSALKKEGIQFDTYSPRPVVVEILKIDTRELGRVPIPPESLSLDFSGIKGSTIVISTLLDEIDLGMISSFNGRVFLDVQGYVRDGRDFGKKKGWCPTREIADFIFCLKATEEEFGYIDSSIGEAFKKRMLLITRGSEGSVLYYQGQEYTTRPRKVISAANTIGAGDVFFAYFISQFVQGSLPFESLEYATSKTSEFLESHL